MATIVIKDQLYRMNLFTEDCRVCTRGPGLVCNPETPDDVIQLYRKMTGNFNCGRNKMLSSSSDPVDRRYLQWRADDGHRSWTHVSVPDKPIRECGRFGYANTPVRDADWLLDDIAKLTEDNHLTPRHQPDYFSSTQYVVSVIIVLQNTVLVGLSVTRCGILYVLKDFSYDVVFFKRARLWMVRC